MSDAPLRDGVLYGGANVLLADQWLGKTTGACISWRLLRYMKAWMESYARPRVIRGTRTKPLPLLPSGPGGGSQPLPLHESPEPDNHPC